MCRTLFFFFCQVRLGKVFFQGDFSDSCFLENLFFDGNLGGGKCHTKENSVPPERPYLQKVLLSDLQWSFLDTIIPSHSDLIHNQAQTLSLGIIQYEKRIELNIFTFQTIESNQPERSLSFMCELVEVVNELGSTIEVEENVNLPVENEQPVDLRSVEI